MLTDFAFFTAIFLCLSQTSPALSRGSEYGPGVCHLSNQIDAGVGHSPMQP